MPKSQKPDGAVAGSTKRLLYQVKTGHCLSGKYLHWTKNRATPQCWWCRYPNQTREHLKVCPEWKAQQKILWAEVKEETREVEGQVEDPGPAGGREVQLGSAGIPNFYGWGRPVPAEGEDTVSEMLGAKLREREEVQGGGGGEQPLFPTPDFMASADEDQGAGHGARCSLFCFSFVVSLVRFTFSSSQAWAGGKGVLTTCPPQR